MSADRDTHFQGFAKLLMRDVDEKNAVKGLSTGRYLDEEELCLIIAQRAYDFADHVIKHLHGSNLDEIQDMGLARFLEEYGRETGYERVPDLAEWPKRS